MANTFNCFRITLKFTKKLSAASCSCQKLEPSVKCIT